MHGLIKIGARYLVFLTCAMHLMEVAIYGTLRYVLGVIYTNLYSTINEKITSIIPTANAQPGTEWTLSVIKFAYCGLFSFISLIFEVRSARNFSKVGNAWV